MDQIELPGTMFCYLRQADTAEGAIHGKAVTPRDVPAIQDRLTGVVCLQPLCLQQEKCVQDFCSREDADPSGLAFGRLEIDVELKSTHTHTERRKWQRGKLRRLKLQLSPKLQSPRVLFKKVHEHGIPCDPILGIVL